MDDSNVVGLAGRRNTLSPERKWKFIQGFMVGIAPVMVAPPFWLPRKPRI